MERNNFLNLELQQFRRKNVVKKMDKFQEIKNYGRLAKQRVIMEPDLDSPYDVQVYIGGKVIGKGKSRIVFKWDKRLLN